MSSLLEGLNPQQNEAVTLPLADGAGAPQSALVLAGAGSGKTRVLTTRIVHLIRSGQLSPAGLLAVTFTNKAAREMLGRISGMLPVNTRGMWVGTFHGLCNRLLRTHHREAGLPQLFQIMDSSDQLAFVKRLLKAMNLDQERYPPRDVQWFISSAKERGLRPDAVRDERQPRLPEIYAAYDAQCNREGVVDFAELLLRCYELLSRNELLLEHYRRRFRHLLVDEFQDTNRLQYYWLRLLAGRDTPLFAVGDDDQSIYAFRGASSENMQDLQRDFARLAIIRLEQNYRSHGNILDAANALISHNQNRLGKNLWTSEGSGEPLRVYEAWSDRDEADYVVEEVRMLRAEGVRLSEVAVLYRSNAQSRAIEHALVAGRIPYRVYGGMRFFERQEVKHALAYLRLVVSPEDDGAFARVVNFPARGIGARTLEQLADDAQQQGGSLWAAALRKSAFRSDATPDPERVAAHMGKRGLDGFIALVASLRAATAGLALPEIIEHVVEASGLKEHYRNEREGADRLENLDELVNAGEAFVMEAGESGLPAAGAEEGTPGPETGPYWLLASFLAHAALEAGEHQAGSGEDALQLMTVHSAKGLEFHSVFVTGLEEGLFPHEQSVHEPGGLEEERRLMYVALTRARRRLYLTRAGSRMLHGQTRYNIASRFLEELPPELLRRVAAGAAQPLTTGYAARTPARSVQSPAPAWSTGRDEPLVTRSIGGWKVGQNVSHPKFGSGVILKCEGFGAEALVEVRFSNGAVKRLLLEYAKLTPA